MNADLKKIEDLLKNNTEFQEKLQNGLSNISDEDISEKNFFEKVMRPLAEEYGVSATYDEYKAYINEIAGNGVDLSPEELSQVSGGGKAPGLGLNLCYKVGLGAGIAGDDDSVCAIAGFGGTGICVGNGVATETDSPISD